MREVETQEDKREPGEEGGGLDGRMEGERSGNTVQRRTTKTGPGLGGGRGKAPAGQKGERGSVGGSPRSPKQRDLAGPRATSEWPAAKVIVTRATPSVKRQDINEC